MTAYFKNISFKKAIFSGSVAWLGSEITFELIGFETQALFQIFSDSFVLHNYLFQFSLLVLYCIFAFRFINKIFAG
ncbi:MAG: hypothetical protein K8R67_06915 [Desulfobacteraceae bacterium]|nr:hypothetical protein [Desulfobacteraceae bacterium]